MERDSPSKVESDAQGSSAGPGQATVTAPVSPSPETNIITPSQGSSFWVRINSGLLATSRLFFYTLLNVMPTYFNGPRLSSNTSLHSVTLLSPPPSPSGKPHKTTTLHYPLLPFPQNLFSFQRPRAFERSRLPLSHRSAFSSPWTPHTSTPRRPTIRILPQSAYLPRSTLPLAHHEGRRPAFPTRLRTLPKWTR